MDDIIKLSPSEFEAFICCMVGKLGYEVRPISIGEDIGIDALAMNEFDKIGIQIKKYIKRKINLSMIYHTYGAAAYYDCSKAVIITLSELTPKADIVANKLGVEIWDKDKVFNLIQRSNFDINELLNKESKYVENWFYEIWKTYIKQLEGKRVKHITRDSYITVLSVDEDGMSIVNSNGRKRKIDIDIFLQVLTRLKDKGSITREEINNDYQRRGSSAISAVLLTLPNIHKDHKADKTTLVWKKQ